MHETKSKCTEWVTPKEIIDALGPFDLDPCAGKQMPWPWRTAEDMLSDCGLECGWGLEQVVWLNPPYGHGVVEPWLERMAAHGSGIALLPTRVDTAWWHDLVLPNATAILWRRGRISFCDRRGHKVTGNTVGSAFVAYGWPMVERLERNIDNPHVGNGGYLEILRGGT